VAAQRLAQARARAAGGPLLDLAKYCNVSTTSFVAGDPHQTALNEGRRDTFNHIAEMLGLTPADFPDIVKEQDA